MVKIPVYESQLQKQEQPTAKPIEAAYGLDIIKAEKANIESLVSIGKEASKALQVVKDRDDKQATIDAMLEAHSETSKLYNDNGGYNSRYGMQADGMSDDYLDKSKKIYDKINAKLTNPEQKQLFSNQYRDYVQSNTDNIIKMQHSQVRGAKIDAIKNGAKADVSTFTMNPTEQNLNLLMKNAEILGDNAASYGEDKKSFIMNHRTDMVMSGVDALLKKDKYNEAKALLDANKGLIDETKRVSGLESAQNGINYEKMSTGSTQLAAKYFNDPDTAIKKGRAMFTSEEDKNKMEQFVRQELNQIEADKRDREGRAVDGLIGFIGSAKSYKEAAKAIENSGLPYDKKNTLLNLAMSKFDGSNVKTDPRFYAEVFRGIENGTYTIKQLDSDFNKGLLSGSDYKTLNGKLYGDGVDRTLFNGELDSYLSAFPKDEKDRVKAYILKNVEERHLSDEQALGWLKTFKDDYKKPGNATKFVGYYNDMIAWSNNVGMSNATLILKEFGSDAWKNRKVNDAINEIVKYNSENPDAPLALTPKHVKYVMNKPKSPNKSMNINFFKELTKTEGDMNAR